MNDEEKEVVYPTVTEEAKSYSDQIMSGFNLEEQMRTGQPPANSEVLPTGETTDTTATGELLPTGEGEQKVEKT